MHELLLSLPLQSCPQTQLDHFAGYFQVVELKVLVVEHVYVWKDREQE